MKQEFLKYKLANMSLSDKIGQMIMIDYRDTLEMNVEFEKILKRYNPGGFILFNSNVANFEQTQRLLSEIKSIGDISTIISVDQEGGRVQRLGERVGFNKHPPMSEIGKTLDESAAFELGEKMGRELKSIGIDMDMAPVLDVFSNPQNRVIADRAFGKNAEIVKKMALSFADGLSRQKIISVGKHFPGHGDTIKDSHIDLPIIEKNLEQLKKLELIPFVEAVRKKLPGLMVAHIAIPKITLDNTPASLSKVLISELLRNDMNYDGLIMPDSLKMKALSNYFTNEQIYLRCVAAGNDFLLMPQDVGEAYNTIYQNVDSGKIPEDRINASVYRILSTKFDYGFFNKEYEQFIRNNRLGTKHK